MTNKIKYKQTEIGEIPEDWNIARLADFTLLNPQRNLKKKQDAKHVSMANLRLFDKKIVNYEIKPYNGGVKFINTDSLLARITPCLENGKTAYVDILDDNEVGFGSTEFIVLNGKEGKTDSQYVYYLSCSPKFRDIAIKSMIGSSGRQRVQTDKLASSVFAFPSLLEQQQIASILSSLDDKIELNRRINKTLEEIGKALFKRWFVDFEFPFDFAQGKPNDDGKPYKSSGAEIVESEFGEIPEGWEVKKLSDFGKIICGKTPPKSDARFFDGKIPFIKIPDMHGNSFIVKTEDALSEKGRDYQKNKTLPKYSLCVSCIATVGLVSITSQESQTNQQINSIVPSDLKFLPYLYFQLKSMGQKLIDYASGGSATPNLNTGDFAGLSIVFPQNKLLSSFFNVVWPLFEQILNNDLENSSLEQTRDSLLPRLMSGKLRIKDYEN